ncbi:hypothetical protein B5M42_021655 [Paenibacillus athensensis]|uniref:Uncharacterized protein n=1 Tax=Paenibacillus athensensis TaxID=1967502 RepID=A0A4Y8Q2S7_9BACL|nr:hypothetical protein [Paenibacillus athensensis]MCD1261411.1 hypothetical protein [Paenibacillus athensensis]
MYNYISIHSNDYTEKIKSAILEQYLTRNLNFEKVRHLIFCKEFQGERIWLRGILADRDGNYAFHTLDGVEEINLIEIDLPVSISGMLAQEIEIIAVAIARELSWIIDKDHGLK